MTPPVPWSLKDYQQKAKDSGINFLREDIVDVEKYGSLVIEHTEWARENSIVIQYTLTDYGHPHYGDWKKAIEFLKPYKDIVILESHNEFLSINNIAEVMEIDKAVKEAGFISSAGAWGYEGNAKDNAKAFLAQYKPDIITMHRPYPPKGIFVKWIADLGTDRPIIENEFLLNNPEDAKFYAETGFESGLQGFNVYGDQWEVMGKLCEEEN